jgi:hypothetical protein
MRCLQRDDGRPFDRATLKEDEALAELRRYAGTQFDPLVVDAIAAVAESLRRPALAAALSAGTGAARLLHSLAGGRQAAVFLRHEDLHRQAG